MHVKFIEATNKDMNWGKFVVCRFDKDEWERRSAIDPGRSILATRGWSPDNIWVLDLETREGAAFKPGGLAAADLQKHKVWVCPLYQPFLEWLYTQDLSDLGRLPAMVNLPEAPFAMYGHRRPGTSAPEA